MSGFLALQRNLARRVRAARIEYGVYALLLVAVAQIALLVAFPAEGRLRVAVVGSGAVHDNPFAGVPWISAAFPDRSPRRSDLAMGRIDAAVHVDGSGTASVLIARSPEVAARLEALLEHRVGGPALPERGGPARGPASTLMGIWIMFLLVVGVLCGRFFIQDRERGIFARLGATPIRAGTYLAANGLFTFVLCFAPPFLMVMVEGMLLPGGLGIRASAWALVLGCASSLAAAFSLLIDALLPDEDQAVSVASMTMLFTSLLSGCFIAPQSQGRLLRAVSTIMPQRAIMELTVRLESGSTEVAAPLSVVAVEVAVFFLVALAVTVRRLGRGRG